MFLRLVLLNICCVKFKPCCACQCRINSYILTLDDLCYIYIWFVVQYNYDFYAKCYAIIGFSPNIWHLVCIEHVGVVSPVLHGDVVTSQRMDWIFVSAARPFEETKSFFHNLTSSVSVKCPKKAEGKIDMLRERYFLFCKMACY